MTNTELKDAMNQFLKEEKSKYIVALFNNFSTSDVLTNDIILNVFENNFTDIEIDKKGALILQHKDAVVETIPVSNMLKVNIFNVSDYTRSPERMKNIKIV